jgi:hypothetical protein
MKLNDTPAIKAKTRSTLQHEAGTERLVNSKGSMDTSLT